MTTADWTRLVRERLGETAHPLRDEDLVEELAQHLALRYEELIARGVAPSLAREQTLAEVDDAGQLAAMRRTRRTAPPQPCPPPTTGRSRMFDDLWQDLKYAARVLARSRAFTAAAVLTLALGIGAATAIFSVVDAVMLRPVPFDALDRLTMVWETDRNTGTIREPASLPDYLDLKERSRQYAQLALFSPSDRTLTSPDGEPSRHPSLFVSHDFLPVLGVEPIYGRGFTAEEDRPGGPLVVLISERLWERRFQRDPSILGRTVRLNDRENTIIGVVPATSDFGVMQVLRGAAYARGFADRDVRSRVDFWLPAQADVRALPRSTHPLFVIGRLAPGATVAGAQQEMAAIMADLEAAYPENVARGAFVEPMADVIFARVRGPLWVLLAAVGFVLLIACVNVANLLLARGTVRLREVAVRTAMGAMPGRLARQFAVENLLLTLVAAVVGIALAFAGLGVLVALAPPDIPRLSTVGIDARVLSAALTIAVATGVLFGMVPVAQARRVDVQSALCMEESRGATAGRERGLLRSVLVVAEVALAVVLMVGAGLLLRSFWRLAHVDAGFDADGIVKAEFQLPTTRYGAPRDQWPNWVAVHGFNERVLARARQLPGVQAAAVVGNHPLDPGSQNSWRVVGREEEGRNWPELPIRRVSPEYFETVGLDVTRGRAFSSGDGPDAPTVAIVNEALVRRFFGGREPLGQQIALWGSARTIVGVTGDERIHGLMREAPPAIYLPLAQAPSFNGGEALLVRTTGPAASLSAALRAAVREIDPGLAVYGVEPLRETLAESVSQQRFVMLLLVVFAALAVILAAIGIHGVLSYAVAQRRHELGIRMALGATPGRVTGLVLRQGMRLTAIGFGIGIAAALALTRVLASLLYGVSPRDALTFAAALPLLAAVAFLAAWLPARRAVRIDPLQAMHRGT